MAFLSNRTTKKGGEGNSLRQLRDGSTTSQPHQLLLGMVLHHLDPLTWSEKASSCLRTKFKTVSGWGLPVKVTVSLHKDGSHLATAPIQSFMLESSANPNPHPIQCDLCRQCVARAGSTQTSGSSLPWMFNFWTSFLWWLVLLSFPLGRDLYLADCLFTSISKM